MASDNISLAVGDGARRMTYAELADMRRISVASAERLVRRRRWERISGNDGVVRVSVPLTEARKTPPRTKRVSVSGRRTSPPDNDVVRTLETAVSVLSAQLAHERSHTDRERTRADLAEARIAELLRRPWWRRLIG